jgi:hypothetical protein
MMMRSPLEMAESFRRHAPDLLAAFKVTRRRATQISECRHQDQHCRGIMKRCPPHTVKTLGEKVSNSTETLGNERAPHTVKTLIDLGLDNGYEKRRPSRNGLNLTESQN